MEDAKVVRSRAHSAEEYLAELPPDRGSVITAVRDTIRANLPPGYEESMQFGMLGYVVPLAIYPHTYNGAPLLYAALANQKGAMSLYLTWVYSDPTRAERFQEAYRATGKRLDMGKSCVRFRRLEDLPLDLVAETIATTRLEDFVALYEQSRLERRA